MTREELENSLLEIRRNAILAEFDRVNAELADAQREIKACHDLIHTSIECFRRAGITDGLLVSSVITACDELRRTRSELANQAKWASEYLRQAERTSEELDTERLKVSRLRQLILSEMLKWPDYIDRDDRTVHYCPWCTTEMDNGEIPHTVDCEYRTVMDATK